MAGGTQHSTGAGPAVNHAGLHPVIILTTLEAEAARWPALDRAAVREARRGHVLALKAAHWKQSAIAAQLGISDALVSRIVRSAHGGACRS
jgi:hypothetical protein